MKGYRNRRNGGISEEYMRKHFLSADGVANVRPMGEKPATKQDGRCFYEPSPEKKKEIEQCLNCKRRNCTGGAGCFRRERKTNHDR